MVDVKIFEIPVLGTPDGFMPTVVSAPVQESQALMAEMNEEAKERLARFSEECARRGISSSTSCETGIPGEIVVREAIAHDWVIMARGGYSRSAGDSRVDPLVSPVIRGSIRPVLVAGQSFREPRRILVAYDGSVHAARALNAAAELGARGDVECTLLNVAPTEEAGSETLSRAESYLFRHGLRPRRKIAIGSRAADLICELVASEGAELLVMGAYGHSPIREMIFGSTTERVLSHCGSSAVLQS
jgi:nucleotide-binding universal stress UspA family protein